MIKPAAIAATFVDFKNVKTRGVLQLVFEVPLHQAKVALDTLGYPDASAEKWFGIAALSSQQGSNPVSESPRSVEDKQRTGGKRDWRELQPAQQAALRCNNPVFIAFLREERTFDMSEATCDPAECIRLICGVASRSELNTNQKARAIWHQLDSQFQAWNAVERVGA